MSVGHVIAALTRPACVQCGAPTHVRRDGSVAQHCSSKCYHRAQSSAARTALYGDVTSPWAMHSPAFGDHLPGAVCEMRIAGEPRGMCSLRGSTVAHGVVSVLTNHPHRPHVHHHALWPDPLGDRWWVLIPSEAAKYVAGRRFRHDVARRTADVAFGPAIRLRTPPAASAGTYRLRIETQTPVVIRSAGSTLTRVDPDASHIASTVSALTCKRLGLDEIPPHMVALRMVDRHTRPWIGLVDRSGSVGGDGRVRGWHGVIEVDASGLAAWLLRCCALIGLGGRTGYGFGRIRLTEVSRA